MAAEKICFKDYAKCLDDKKLSKTRKKINRKRKDGSSKNVYGWAGYGPPPNLSGAPAAGATSGGSPGAAAAVGEGYTNMHRLGYEAPPRSERSEPSRLQNVYKQGKGKMKFSDYLDNDKESNDEVAFDEEKMVKKITRMHQQGMSIEDIASELGMSPKDVWFFMSDEGDFGEDEEDVDDEDMSDDEFERRYDVERDEEDTDQDKDESDWDDDEEPEYADEVKVGSWTISRLDDEEDDGEDEDYDREFDPDYSADEFDVPSRDDFDDDKYSSEEDYEYAEDAEEPSQKDQARSLYRAMSAGDYSRQDIINAFEKRLGLSSSSATAYYQRIAKEYGETEQQGGLETATAPGGMGGMDTQGMEGLGPEEEMGQEGPEYQEPQEWEDPHRQGVIRTVQGAHLVFKRQADDGSFEELWIYKEGEKFQDELGIRHDILAGTDIPINKTQSPDGSQKAETWSAGDVQYLSITGLPN